MDMFVFQYQSLIVTDTHAKEQKSLAKEPYKRDYIPYKRGVCVCVCVIFFCKKDL